MEILCWLSGTQRRDRTWPISYSGRRGVIWWARRSPSLFEDWSPFRLSPCSHPLEGHREDGLSHAWRALWISRNALWSVQRLFNISGFDECNVSASITAICLAFLWHAYLQCLLGRPSRASCKGVHYISLVPSVGQIQQVCIWLHKFGVSRTKDFRRGCCRGTW